MLDGNGKEVSARSAFGLDMRSEVTAMGVQQGMSRKRLPHQRDLPPAVKYQNPEKRQRDRRQARRDDGRATDAKQTQKYGRITAICVGSASPSPTHGDQRGGSSVQANHPSSGISAARSGNTAKHLCLPDTKMMPNMPKDTFPTNVSTSSPGTSVMKVQPDALGFVVQAQDMDFRPGGLHHRDV